MLYTNKHIEKLNKERCLESEIDIDLKLLRATEDYIKEQGKNLLLLSFVVKGFNEDVLDVDSKICVYKKKAEELTKQDYVKLKKVLSREYFLDPVKRVDNTLIKSIKLLSITPFLD